MTVNYCRDSFGITLLPPFGISRISPGWAIALSARQETILQGKSLDKQNLSCIESGSNCNTQLSSSMKTRCAHLKRRIARQTPGSCSCFKSSYRRNRGVTNKAGGWLQQPWRRSLTIGTRGCGHLYCGYLIQRGFTYEYGGSALLRGRYRPGEVFGTQWRDEWRLRYRLLSSGRCKVAKTFRILSTIEGVITAINAL
jgi:hypothetical protein